MPQTATISVVTNLVLMAAFAGSWANAAVETAPLPAIIPKPQRIEMAPGRFEFDEDTRILAEGEARPIAHRLAQLIEPATGFDLRVVRDFPRSGRVVHMRLFGDCADLGPEGYEMIVSPHRVQLNAATPNGLFYGVQTIRQMLPPEIEKGKPVRNVEWSIPVCTITDRPKFKWRGMHLDESRHFFGMEFVKKYIDLIALHKMNVFHWHLVDDGGWRLEIKGHPRLTEIGAWRVKTDRWDQSALRFPGRDSGEDLYGGFYTQEQVKEIVRYAADRFVTIVPEIEMPGHSMPVLAAYPALQPVDPKSAEPPVKNGRPRFNMVNPGSEYTFTFLQSVLDEVLELFPSEYIHIGADEVWKEPWSNCPDCQKRIRTEGLNGVDELQSYFVKRIENYLWEKGRRLIGWDEILEGGLAPRSTVMSWRGTKGGIAAAKQGHDVVMSPAPTCYFDYPYERTTLPQVYFYRPIPKDLTPEEGARILGAQGNVWTEWMPTRERVEWMTFPRMLALAEAVWTDGENRDYDDFTARLAPYYRRLDALDTRYYVPPPSAEYDAVIFADRATVRLLSSGVPGMKLHYTLDGSDPTASSPVYSAPLVVTKPAKIRAKMIKPAGPISETFALDCVQFSPEAGSNFQPGVDVKFAKGDFAAVPDFATLKGVMSSVLPFIDYRPYDNQDRFALEYSGYFKVEADGPHTFTLGSDDGSVLEIAGAVVVNNDGLHGYREVSSRVMLKKGYYPFRLRYFEADGAESLQIFVQAPGDGARKRIGPGMAFRRGTPGAPAPRARPAAPTKPGRAIAVGGGQKGR